MFEIRSAPCQSQFFHFNFQCSYTQKKNLPKFFCSRGCIDSRIFWKILLLHKNIFCTSSNSFAPIKYLRFGKNIYASRRISSSVGDICSACEDFIKISEFYRRYNFCARRNIFCARRKSHIFIIHPLQKINHLHQKNKFICNRKYSSVTTSSAAEDSIYLLGVIISFQILSVYAILNMRNVTVSI
jgi:hypothetical protein